MTWALLLALAVAGAIAVCFALGRRNVPADLDEWCARLHAESASIQSALELQVAADNAMSRDALRRAEAARDSASYAEAVRLVDVAFGVLEGATADRMTRLRGMALCVRMIGAVLPVAPLRVNTYRLREVRALAAVGALLHHVLVSAAERFLLRLFVLRFAYRLTLRAMRGGVERIHVDPQAAEAWVRCDEAVSDWTGGLDPAHVEAFRAFMASTVTRRAA